MKRPVEEVARAIYENRNGRGCVPWSRYRYHDPYFKDAKTVLDRLVQLGFLNDNYFVAKKAEEAEATGKGAEG